MSICFDVTLEDGRIAHCWRAVEQPYQDCQFSAGLVEGIEPDTIYLRMERDEDWQFFLRPDEALALLHCLTGALWSAEIIKSNSGNSHDKDDFTG